MGASSCQRQQTKYLRHLAVSGFCRALYVAGVCLAVCLLRLGWPRRLGRSCGERGREVRSVQRPPRDRDGRDARGGPRGNTTKPRDLPEGFDSCGHVARFATVL